MLNMGILLVIGGFIAYMLTLDDRREPLYVMSEPEPAGGFYKTCLKVGEVSFPDPIRCMDCTPSGVAYVVAGEYLYRVDPAGLPHRLAAVGSGVRSLARSGEELYLLYPARIEVRATGGSLLREWEACSDDADYCAIALSERAAYVTDATHKHICQYTLTGGLVRLITPPDGFVVPSYAFDVAWHRETLYCINPGRHRVERYTADGKYLGAFGIPGRETGAFSGCCNPVYIALTPEGEVLTSEKGVPRVVSFGSEGAPNGLLFTPKMLGGGNGARRIAALEEGVAVAGGRTLTRYRYALPEESKE